MEILLLGQLFDINQDVLLFVVRLRLSTKNAHEEAF